MAKMRSEIDWSHLLSGWDEADGEKVHPMAGLAIDYQFVSQKLFGEISHESSPARPVYSVTQ